MKCHMGIFQLQGLALPPLKLGQWMRVCLQQKMIVVMWHPGVCCRDRDNSIAMALSINVNPIHWAFPEAQFRIKTWIIIDYNTRPTQKSPVRQQNAWFDRKKPGSTEKCPIRQKNALPRMHQLTLPLSNIPPPPPLRNIFFQFFSHIFLTTNREMKIKLFWY